MRKKNKHSSYRRVIAIVLILLIVVPSIPIFVNALMKLSCSFIETEGDISSWISFWGNYAGGIFGALIGGGVAYLIATSQNKIQMELMKKEKYFEMQRQYIEELQLKFSILKTDINNFQVIGTELNNSIQNTSTNKFFDGENDSDYVKNSFAKFREIQIIIQSNLNHIISLIGSKKKIIDIDFEKLIKCVNDNELKEIPKYCTQIYFNIATYPNPIQKLADETKKYTSKEGIIKLSSEKLTFYQNIINDQIFLILNEKLNEIFIPLQKKID